MRIGRFEGSKEEIKELLVENGFKYEDYFVKSKLTLSEILLLLGSLLIIYQILF